MEFHRRTVALIKHGIGQFLGIKPLLQFLHALTASSINISLCDHCFFFA